MANTFKCLIFDAVLLCALLILSQQRKSILGTPEGGEITSINFFQTYLQCFIPLTVPIQCIGRL